MSSIYERLDVPTIINAKGTSTRLGGGLMPVEAAQAMFEASQACVDMAQMQARASEIIAGITGAEAGIVTCGAAAGLLLGTAACVTGFDLGKMSRLPDVRGMKDEVIIARSQRNAYDHAVRAAGVRLVEVGLPDRLSGAGVRDAEPWEYVDAASASEPRPSCTSRNPTHCRRFATSSRSHTGRVFPCSSMPLPSCRRSTTCGDSCAKARISSCSAAERRSAGRRAPASCVAGAIWSPQRCCSGSTPTSRSSSGIHRLR